MLRTSVTDVMAPDTDSDRCGMLVPRREDKKDGGVEEMTTSADTALVTPSAASTLSSPPKGE